MNLRNWDDLYKKIGPLRYQSSESDCVPTTLVNGLTVLFERRLNPKLLQLIWGLSLDREHETGTGWVCCDVLSNLLTKWFQRAYEDEYEKKQLPFTSRIIEGDSVHLGRSNPILRCLNSGGVVCLSTADHYYLIVGVDEDEGFLVFDCWWDQMKTPNRLKKLGSYKGLVNTRWTRVQLQKILGKYRWVHLLSKTGGSKAP
jgi:hypothetical protein